MAPLSIGPRTNRWRRKAAASMGIIGLLLFFVTFHRQRTALAQSLQRDSAADYWSNANMRAERTLQWQIFLDMFRSTGKLSAKRGEDYTKRIATYREEQDESQSRAREEETNAALADRRVRWFSWSEAILEIAIVLVALALFTRRAGYWYVSLLAGVAGAAMGGLPFTELFVTGLRNFIP